MGYRIAGNFHGSKISRNTPIGLIFTVHIFTMLQSSPILCNAIPKIRGCYFHAFSQIAQNVKIVTSQKFSTIRYVMMYPCWYFWPLAAFLLLFLLTFGVLCPSDWNIYYMFLCITATVNLYYMQNRWPILKCQDFKKWT